MDESACEPVDQTKPLHDDRRVIVELPGGIGKSRAAPYLVRAREETGYSLEGPPTPVSSPAQFGHGEADEAAETRRLTEEGFYAAPTVRTTGSNRAGVSSVIELGMPSAAQHEVAASLQQTVATEHPSSQFTIATIPDSHGWVEPPGNGKVAANVLFSERLCVLIVGDKVPSGTDPKPALIAGALKVFGRTAHSNGVCAREWRPCTYR